MKKTIFCIFHNSWKIFLLLSTTDFKNLSHDFQNCTHSASFAACRAVWPYKIAIAFCTNVAANDRAFGYSCLHKYLLVCKQQINHILSAALILYNRFMKLKINKSLRYGRIHLIAALTDSRTYRSDNILRICAELLCHWLHCDLRYAWYSTSPACMTRTDSISFCINKK